jgi:prolyl-tRNA synthetase
LYRLGLKYAVADADTGNIGGNKSHEFQVLSEYGGNSLLFCNQCSYISNVEKAKGLLPQQPQQSTTSTLENLTQNSTLLKKVNPENIKFCYFSKNNKKQVVLVLIDSNRKVNPFKVKFYWNFSE